MTNYYVNNKAQANGDHEVHTEECIHFSVSISSVDLGDYYGCDAAIRKAKTIYTQSNGCFCCCKACHALQLNEFMEF